MMTLAEAMACRKRLAGRLQRVRNDVRTHNRFVVGNPEDVNVSELLGLEDLIFEKLCELRGAIAVANTEIWSKLLRMSELKDRIGFVGSIPTDRGTQPATRWGLHEDAQAEWDAVLKKGDVTGRVAELERELVGLQREVERHNHATQIYVEVPDDLLF